MDLLRRFNDYLNSPQNKLSNKTVKNYKADISSFISWYKKQYNQELGITPTNITSQIVDLYKRAKIQESNLSPNSLKRHLSSLRRFFQFLKTEGIIIEDPFEEMKNLLKNTLIMQDKWHLQAFKNYLYFYSKSNLTVKNYILDVRHFLTWIEQVTKENVFSKINDTLVNEYKKRLLEHGFSPRTINRKLSSLRKYLKWLALEGYIQSSEFPAKQDLAPRDKVQSSKLNNEVTLESPPLFNPEIYQYSRFPPLRLMQKTLRGIGFIDALKPKTSIFSGVIPNFTPRSKSVVLPSIPHISAIPKEFYAPLSISTRYFPLYKKAWHYIRYQRPEWYRTYHSHSIIHYFHLAILILFISQFGFVINQSITPKPESQTSVLGTLETIPPRILSFNGKLSDIAGNPISGSAKPVRMSIYNDETASGSSLLWQEVVEINTDSEGRFGAVLGNNTFLSQNLFAENEALWLGVSVAESPELVPREQIAGVSLANNTEKLQGLSPITSPDANTKNVILALDSSGNLTIDGDASPTFQATGGTFKLLGQTLVLSTTPGTNSNVEIAPTDLGKIDLQKPIFNSTENNNVNQAIGSVEIDDSLAVLATTSAHSAFTINQNSTGNLIGAYTNGVEKFVINNSGNIISATGSKWQPFSDSTSALNIANAEGNSFITFDTSNSRVGIGTTTPKLKLDVQDEKAASGAAQIFNTNTGTDADGLIIKLGNTSSTAVDNANHFISFETAGIGIVGSIRGSGAGVDFKTPGIADFAEYLKKDENQEIEYGSLVCINEDGLVLPCDQTNNKIVGIASNHGGFTGGIDLGDASIRVGFVGQAYTKVSALNGKIKPGDPLTYSSISGVAVKTIKEGQIIGKALESFDDTKILGYYDIEKKEHIDKSSLPPNILISQYPNIIPEGKILVSISVSWYDPSPSNDTTISPIPEVDKIHNDIISPLASAPPADPPAPQNDITFETQNSSSSATVTDSLEISSTSGSLSTETIEEKQPSNILVSQYPNINTFPEGLIAFGPTSLTDVSIIGQLSIGNIGGSFIITQNSINAIGAVLELQPLRQGALSIMGGLVYIDTNGDLKVDGNAQFSKDVAVGGDIIASGSGTFSKLNLSIAKNAFALSSKELIATGSAGTAYVRAREVEVTINNNLVTDKSLIYITPAGTPSGQIPFLLRQVPEEPILSETEGSFTVGIASASATKTPFNWLIIN